MRYLLIILINILLFFGFCQSLSISEVFFDGRTEWIEIYNPNNQTFSGSLMLSGAKASSITFETEIPPGGYGIIVDGTDHTFDCSILDDAGLSLSDTKEIITLLSGNSFTDSWEIPESIISKYNNQNRSLIYSGGVFTGSENIYMTGVFATPCATNILVENNASAGTGSGVEGGGGSDDSGGGDDEGEQGDNPGDGSGDDNGDDTGDSSCLDNSDNNDNSDDGGDDAAPDDISSINKADRLYLNEMVIKEIYPYDDEKSSEFVLIKSNVVYTGSLTIGGLGHGAGSKTITHDFIVGSELLIVDSDFATTSGFLAFQSSPYSGIDTVTLPAISLTDGGETLTLEDEHENIIFTYEYSDTSNFTPFFTAGTSDVSNKPADSLSGIIISELHPQNEDQWGEYIELACINDYCKGELSTVGLGRGDVELPISINLQRGQFLLLYSGVDNYPKTVKKRQKPSLSLTDGGEKIILHGQSGQVIDTVVYSGSESGRSLYFSGDSSYFSIPTPGISETLCEEIYGNPEESLTYCSIELQNNSTFTYPNKINLAARLNNQRLSNTQTTYRCEWKYNNKPIITSGLLEGCNPLYIGFSTGGMISLQLKISTDQGVVCQTSTSINYPALEEDNKPNRTNYYKGLYNKRKTRHQNLEDKIRDEGYTVSGSEDILKKKGDNKSGDQTLTLLTGALTIEALLPNPKGSDDQERVVLYNHTNEDITEKLYLKRNRRRHLDEITVLAKNQLVLTGSLGLVNKPACIQLQSDRILYDTFCYGDVVEGVMFEREDRIGELLETGIVQTIPGLGLYELEFTDAEVCIVYEDYEVSCEELDIAKDDLKILKKTAKKAESAQKKSERYKKRYKKYKKQLEGIKDEFTVYKSMQKRSYGLIEELLYLRRDKLIENDGIYTSNGYRDLYNGFRQLDKTNGLRYFGVLPIGSVEERISLQEGYIPLTDMPISTISKNLYKQTKESYTQFILPLIQ